LTRGKRRQSASRYGCARGGNCARARASTSGLFLPAGSRRVALASGLRVPLALLVVHPGLDLVAEGLVDFAPVLEGAGQDWLGDSAAQMADDVVDEAVA